MKKLCILFVLFFCIHAQTEAQYGSFDSAKTVRPFKIFDNLYYVGVDMVSAYLLVTDKGLILIDALYGEYTAQIPVAISDLGFSIKDVKYILCTHGHFDHCEGAGMLQKLTHARIGMTSPDWEMAEGTSKDGYESVHSIISRDLVIHDNDSLTLGNTTLRFYETPGHTPGVLSIAFPVRDKGITYQAFMLGGVGLNFQGVARTQMYLRSIDRIMKLKGIQVNISNHPGPGKIFERAALLSQYNNAGAHPFVAPGEFQSWLLELKIAAERKLVEEKKKEIH